MEKSLNWREFVITRLIKASGYSAILFVALIFFFLIREGLPTFGEVKLSSLLGTRWYPIEDYFGILPLITGSIVITFGAALIAVPFGIGTAVYISEISPRWMREILKPLVELLGGLPSVVLGFLGFLVLAPFLRVFLNLPTGLTALAGSLLLGGIAVPTVVSVAEDALDAVPRAYREGAWALGATRWQTIWRVTLPAAKSGVLTAVMLGVGRAIGETMTVMMVTGNAPVLAIKLSSLFSPVRTMTATIAAEMGEVANGSTHYHVLFFIGMVLFLISMAVNVAASSVVFRAKKRAENFVVTMKNILTRNRHLTQQVGFTTITLMAFATVLPIVAVVIYILIQGLPAISTEFLTGFPHDGMRAGGILPAIIGTIYLTIGTAIFSVPLGIAAAIYLSEYASDTPLTRTIRIAIINLAGIPSVVYGLFGLGLFVLFLNFGTSILAASLTLSIMTLPVIISTAEEALRSVPQAFRTVSISLGATRWQTIRRIVLKEALPGILTGVILGLERAAGETAPILFTGAAFFLPRLPHSPFDATMALPYHLFVISTQVPEMPIQIQYGTALVLLVFVLTMNLVATVIRSRARARRQW